MSKQRKIDDILDECLERLLINGETLEECLQRYPDRVDELKPLLETVLAGRELSSLQPGIDFRERARNQFISAIREAEEKKARPLFSWNWQPRLVATVAIMLAILIAGGGTVFASGGSMPDSPLYSVKLATEQVRLTFTFSGLDKAGLHAQLADRRVTEIAYLAGKNDTEKIASTTDSLNTHLTKLVTLASGQLAMSGATRVQTAEEAAAPMVEAEAEEESVVEREEAVEEEAKEPVLSAPAPEPKDLPPSPKAVEVEKATVAEEVAVPAELAVRDAEPLQAEDPRATLKSQIAVQANDNIARLKALLATVPESARPTLLRAISILEKGYENALESLE